MKSPSIVLLWNPSLSSYDFVKFAQFWYIEIFPKDEVIWLVREGDPQILSFEVMEEREKMMNLLGKQVYRPR
jgi:hypothetical protein